MVVAEALEVAGAEELQKLEVEVANSSLVAEVANSSLEEAGEEADPSVVVEAILAKALGAAVVTSCLDYKNCSLFAYFQ
jgi:hypothetical protein